MTAELICARNAAEKAGAMILSLLGTATVSQKESNFNLVTSADTAAQHTITDLITELFPEDCIYGEESEGRPALDSDRLWIIDPIDGTTNFAHGIPHFSISIAFARRGVVECGVIFDPSKNELFSAQRGHGAWCNDSPIHVSPVATLTGAIIGTGFYYERGPMMVHTLESMKQLYMANIQGMRRIGSAALDLCYVACGRFDAYFEYQLSPWDFAAGICIVKEAGGICRDCDEIDRGLHTRGMLCCTPALQREFFDIVRWNDL